MKIKSYLIITTLFVVSLFGCSKSKDDVAPANTAELLARKWSFDEVSVKTDAKTYAIPSVSGVLFGDDNTLTFNKDNTLSYLEDGKTVTDGSWKLSSDNKKLTITDSDKVGMELVVNSVSSTTIELSSNKVDLTNTNPTLNDMVAGFIAETFLLLIDKDNGGTVDFTKEPEIKSVQFILKGKAL